MVLPLFGQLKRGQASHIVRQERKRAQKRSAHEVQSESSEREAGGGAEGKPDVV